MQIACLKLLVQKWPEDDASATSFDHSASCRTIALELLLFTKGE